MGSELCERCGNLATVVVSTIPPNRDGVVQPGRTHHYCSDCARAAGVRIRKRRPQSDGPPSADESPLGDPPDWNSLQQFYELMARIPLADADQRAEVASDAEDMLSFLDRMSYEAPPALRAVLERLARGAT